MKKIFKPLIFAVCLVVVFAIGYSLGPGKGTAVDNSDELQRLQKQLAQKNKQLGSLQQSLDVLKQEQAVLKQDMANKASEQQAKTIAEQQQATSDHYTASTDVGDLTFYNDLPKQAVKPEPLKGDATKLPSGPQAVVKPIAAAAAPTTGASASAKQNKTDTVATAAGTSHKPLDATQVLTPSPSQTQSKATPLPPRYIPPGFERGHVVAPPKASAKGAYVVQMGSFKTEAATATLRKKLAEHGFAAHVKQGDIKGKAVFRVFVGAYQSYADAKQVRAMLKKRVKIEGLVVKVKK